MNSSRSIRKKFKQISWTLKRIALYERHYSEGYDKLIKMIYERDFWKDEAERWFDAMVKVRAILGLVQGENVTDAIIKLQYELDVFKKSSQKIPEQSCRFSWNCDKWLNERLQSIQAWAEAWAITLP